MNHAISLILPEIDLVLELISLGYDSVPFSVKGFLFFIALVDFRSGVSQFLHAVCYLLIIFETLDSLRD